MTVNDILIGGVAFATCAGVPIYVYLIREFVRLARQGSSASHNPRPDYAKIAVLEYDLFGIEPRPGTAAALAVGLRRTSRPHDDGRAARARTTGSVTD